MTLAAPDGSIAAGPSPRPDLLVFEIEDKITRPDIEWMASSVDQAFDALGQIDMLVIFKAFEGADLGAVFDGTALGVEVRSLSHVRRYAVVGAPSLATAMITMMNPISPVEAKTFDRGDLASAWAWLQS